MQHLIQFEFICSQAVPLYDHLCQQYQQHPNVEIHTAKIIDEKFNCRYVLEADGALADLEQLADDIAADFLLSVWLLDTKITRLEHPQLAANNTSQQKASEQQANHQFAPLNFCQHCQPQFADNQHSQFGNIDLACEHCGGETKLSVTERALTTQDIFAFADLLLDKQTLHLPDDNMTLSIAQPGNVMERPAIIVCNPNALNGYFNVTEQQVLALSSIEKPCLKLHTNESGMRCIKAPLVDVQFADSRLMAILCERLRQKGINWLYSHSNQPGEHHGNPPLKLAWINQRWVAKQQVAAGQCISQFPALHDEAQSLISNLAYTATSKGSSKFIRWQAMHTQNQEVLPKTHAAQCAMLAGLQAQTPPPKCKKPKNAAVLFFSRYQASQIVSLDGQGQTELFFELAAMPSSGYEICHLLSQSREKALLDKFKQAYPSATPHCLILSSLPIRNHLPALWRLRLRSLAAKSTTTHRSQSPSN
ncbi:hypothetical protein EXU30_08280 [Shewanella maritima]|uniref:Uncharacterized protein n=1 Tax=Shewanella maritima TaxID=2520507 RepID=A0A411PGL4_9GAMM|nr:hypothetical protein [Shewanella maritima]QBF82685.1 hypothetical protein EXU30_08280 [Shewanella maritima]